jgi:hypothetical protein
MRRKISSRELVIAYLQEVELANGEPAVETPENKLQNAMHKTVARKYLYHAEACETTNVDAKFMDIVALHPIQYCFPRLKPRIKVQKFRPVWRRPSCSTSKLGYLVKLCTNQAS